MTTLFYVLFISLIINNKSLATYNNYTHTDPSEEEGFQCDCCGLFGGSMGLFNGQVQYRKVVRGGEVRKTSKEQVSENKPTQTPSFPGEGYKLGTTDDSSGPQILRKRGNAKNHIND